jgi:hypothetical protein
MQWNVLVFFSPFFADRSLRRSLCHVALAASLLACLGLSLPTPSASAQTRTQQVPPTDTGQTKLNQPQPTATAAPDAQPPATITLATLTDPEGVLSVAVPLTWNDIARNEWRVGDSAVGRTFSASPNQADFAANWETPGVAIFYSTSLPAAMQPEDVLSLFDYSATCEDGGRGALPPGQRSVIYQIWQDCADVGTAVAVLHIAPTTSRDFYAVVEIYMTSTEELRALGPILQSVRIRTGGGEAAGGQPSQPSAEAAATPVEPTPAPAEPTPTPSPTQSPVLVAVITDRLNLRGGPSTDVPRLTVVTRGMQLTVVGQVENCAWLEVVAPDGQRGWVSGDPQFTDLAADCAAIPVVSP